MLKKTLKCIVFMIFFLIFTLSTYANENEEINNNDTTLDFSVIIPKIVIVNGSHNEDNIGEYLIQVKGNLPKNEYLSVKPSSNNFEMFQDGKEEIKATIIQNKYMFKSYDTMKYETNKDYEDSIYGLNNDNFIVENGSIQVENMTAGCWNGSFNFEIEHKQKENLDKDIKTINVNAITKDKITIDAQANIIQGEEKQYLLDELKESNAIEDANKINDLIEISSQQFEDISYATFDTNELINNGNNVAILYFDENFSQWEIVGEDIVIDSKVICDFTKFSPIDFVLLPKDSINDNYHIHHFETQSYILPTCTTNGEKFLICNTCNNEEFIVIKAYGHKYTETRILEPTCDVEGVLEHTCIYGDDSYTTPINPNGHSFSEEYTIDEEPTCTKEGSKSKHCIVCDTRNEIIAIPMLDHHYSD